MVAGVVTNSVPVDELGEGMVSIMAGNGATLGCSENRPATLVPLTVLPQHRILVEGQPAANITDFVPHQNIPSFGQCLAPANPAVAVASAAAGLPTTAPCVPLVTAPWTAGAGRVNLAGAPALGAGSTCRCQWGGVIHIVQSLVCQTSLS